MNNNSETIKLITEKLPLLDRAFHDDYHNSMTFIDNYLGCISYEFGRSYCRIVVTKAGNSSTLGFICLKEFTTKERVNFVPGDLMKAAGWKAPALNFPRGNIFNLSSDYWGKDVAKHIKWIGIA